MVLEGDLVFCFGPNPKFCSMDVFLVPRGKAEDFKKFMKVQHIVFFVNEDGKLHAIKTDHFIAAVFANEELFHGIKDNLLANVTKDHVIRQTPISWIMIFFPIHPPAPDRKEIRRSRRF